MLWGKRLPGVGGCRLDLLVNLADDVVDAPKCLHVVLCVTVHLVMKSEDSYIKIRVPFQIHIVLLLLYNSLVVTIWSIVVGLVINVVFDEVGVL